jgi:hypothetical protein
MCVSKLDTWVDHTNDTYRLTTLFNHKFQFGLQFFFMYMYNMHSLSVFFVFGYLKQRLEVLIILYTRTLGVETGTDINTSNVF